MQNMIKNLVYWEGKLVTEMTREELVAALIEMADIQEKQREQYSRHLELTLQLSKIKEETAIE